MIIAIGNLKGGTGKTTIAVNLAAALGAVIVDADSQASATEWKAVPVHPWTLDNPKDSQGWRNRVLRLPSPVVIDLPPHIGTATQSALLIADMFLIPVTPSLHDIRATKQVIDLLEFAQLQRNGLPKGYIIPSKVDRRTASGREIEEALKPFNFPITPAICQRSAFADSILSAQWVGDYSPGSKAHEEILKLAKMVKQHEK